MEFIFTLIHIVQYIKIRKFIKQTLQTQIETNK